MLNREPIVLQVVEGTHKDIADLYSVWVVGTESAEGIYLDGNSQGVYVFPCEEIARTYLEESNLPGKSWCYSWQDLVEVFRDSSETHVVVFGQNGCLRVPLVE